MLPADAQARLLELFPALGDDARRLSLAVYRELACGQPLALSRLAKRAGLDEAVVMAQLKQWPGVFYDEEQRIVGYWGLSLSRMAHRFMVNGRDLYTWCAWDSLFIPQLLGHTAHVESVCPVTRQTIRLTVSPQGIERLQPATAVMSLMVPSDADVMQNIVTRFCHYVHFFASQDAGASWVTRNLGTFLLSVAQAQALGRLKNAAQYAGA